MTRIQEKETLRSQSVAEKDVNFCRYPISKIFKDQKKRKKKKKEKNQTTSWKLKHFIF